MAEQKTNTYSTLTASGARKVLNLVNDVANGRKVAVTFIMEPKSQQLVETHTRNLIIVDIKERKE